MSKINVKEASEKIIWKCLHCGLPLGYVVKKPSGVTMLQAEEYDTSVEIYDGKVQCACGKWRQFMAFGVRVDELDEIREWQKKE